MIYNKTNILITFLFIYMQVGRYVYFNFKLQCYYLLHNIIILIYNFRNGFTLNVLVQNFETVSRILAKVENTILI